VDRPGSPLIPHSLGDCGYVLVYGTIADAMSLSPPSSAVAELLRSLAVGELRLATSTNVDETLAQLANLSGAETNGLRVITLDWDRLPQHPSVLEETLDQLAEGAKMLWPDWYLAGSEDDVEKISLENLCDRARRAGYERQVVPHWLSLADQLCRVRLLPRTSRNFIAEVESRQLSLALGAEQCRLVLAVRGAEQTESALFGLARGAEWLARTTGMPLVVLVPAEIADAHVLDSISFRRIELVEPGVDDNRNHLPKPALPAIKTVTGGSAQPATIAVVVTRPAPQARPRLLIHPLVGRPHPDSLGEQLLWDALQADAELANLFRCNQWAATDCQTRYLVDFSWVDGRVVIEVDGYYWHSSQFSFAADRRRDYELQLTGYVVIRLPHDELIADIGESVEKIRRMVRLRSRGGIE